MPFPFLAAASLISGGISALKGASQKKQANQMIADNPFPEMVVPSAILQNQRLAQSYANQGLPSEQYNQARQNIARNGITALRGAGDRRGGLMAIGTIGKAANDATLGLDVADANMKRQNQQRLMAQNNVLGQWQNNVWDWNKRQKYLQTAAAARALMGAGNYNFNQGLDRGLSGALQGADLLINKGNASKDWGKQTSSNNPSVRYDASGNEYYVDPYSGEPIR